MEKKRLTDDYIFHRQMLKTKREDCTYKTKYRREETEGYGYDWESHQKAVRQANPIDFVVRWPR